MTAVDLAMDLRSGAHDLVKILRAVGCEIVGRDDLAHQVRFPDGWALVGTIQKGTYILRDPQGEQRAWVLQEKNLYGISAWL